MTLIDRSSLSTLTSHVEAYEPDIDRVLITSEEIQAKLAEMGERIGNDYAGRKLLLVGVLKGAFVVMADLARYIRLPLEFDFMAVSSYGAATKTSGVVVRILKDLDHDLEGLDVLLVEDIVDSGLTLNYLLKNLRGAQAGVARGGGAAAQGRSPARATRHPLYGLRDPERVRGGLRPGLRGAVPEPAVHRDAPSRGVRRGVATRRSGSQAPPSVHLSPTPVLPSRNGLSARAAPGPVSSPPTSRSPS